jgi:hypothetical protein
MEIGYGDVEVMYGSRVTGRLPVVVATIGHPDVGK